MFEKIAIIHTTPATIEPLKSLAAEVLPGYEVINLMDDSILPELLRNGGNLSQVESRLVYYAGVAEQVNARAILCACSSVGELVESMQKKVAIPVIRIDEAMAEEAVGQSANIGVAATLPTTLRPTQKLLQEKAQEIGKPISVTPVLAQTAYQKLLAGDRDGHDQDLVRVLTELAEQVDLIVLAQASMARVLSKLPDEIQGMFRSSPRRGMEQVRVRLAQAAAGAAV